MTRKGKLWAGAYALALTAFTIWLALDTFVIRHVYASAQLAVQTAASETESIAAEKSEAAEAADSVYDDGQTRIVLSEYRVANTSVYVADVTLTSAGALASVLAQDLYGRNLTETTSAMAARSGAVLAVNGDYYGSRERGYVIRNGVLYRSSGSRGQQDLVIDANGDFSIILEESVSAEALAAAGAQQVYSFGPALVVNGAVSVAEGTEVSRAMTSNPRTALAQVGPLHYLFVVADGRSDASEGLSLYALADFLQSLGAQTAYNLDGGGSSAMVFNGEIVNNPTTTGNRSKERSVSDIVGIF